MGNKNITSAYYWVKRVERGAFALAVFPSMEEKVSHFLTDKGKQARRLNEIWEDGDKFESFHLWMKVCFFGEEEHFQSQKALSAAISADKVGFRVRKLDGTIIQSDI